MTLETAHLIHSIADSLSNLTLIIILFCLISLFVIICLDPDASCAHSKKISKKIPMVSFLLALNIVILFVSSCLCNYTEPKHSALKIKVKGELVKSGLEELDYDKILDFIKEAKK